MKKIILLCLTLIFIAGCTFSNTSENTGTGFQYSGQQGLYLTIKEPSRDKYYVNENVPVVVNAQNRGRFDVLPEFRIAGDVGNDPSFDKNIQVASSLIEQPYQGDEAPTIPITIGSVSYKDELAPQSIDKTLKVQACFDYHTDITSDFYFGDVESEISSISISSSQNSDAPVHITELRESAPLSQEANQYMPFTLTIEDLNYAYNEKNNVYTSGIVSSCPDDIGSFEKQPLVEVSIIKPDVICKFYGPDYQLSEGSSGTVLLNKNGERKIDCLAIRSQEEAYTDNLVATLDYTYLYTLETTITIANA